MSFDTSQPIVDTKGDDMMISSLCKTPTFIFSLKITHLNGFMVRYFLLVLLLRLIPGSMLFATNIA